VLPPGPRQPKSDHTPGKLKPQYGGEGCSPPKITLVDIVRTNRWRRPLCALINTWGAAGVAQNLTAGRIGLFWRIVPLAQPRPDEGLLRTNVLGHNQYRGYADAHVRVDDFSEGIGFLYHVAIKPLLTGGTGSRGPRGPVATTPTH